MEGSTAMLEGLGGSFGGLVTWVMGWLVKLGTAAVVVLGGWHMLKVILAGGHGREAWRAVLALLVLAVVFAALSDWRNTFELVGQAGQTVWGAVVAEARAAMATQGRGG
jgi:hypothetical protein